MGQPLDAPFSQDPIEVYGVRLLTALLIFGAALILYSLLRYRGRIEGSLSWGVLVAGVLIVPALSTMFGTLLVFERAERVEFCGSCHKAMQAYVDDMRNPDSASLAAVHYKNRYIPRNQCYTCHTSFGMFGTVHAKIAGLVDVHKYYTGKFHLPLKMREAYRNDDCLKCHAGSVKWSANHFSFKNAILAGDTRCIDCHGLNHPPHRLADQLGDPRGAQPGAQRGA
ncbi:MAG: NapC/NirT family cytochrome c, partial [Bryobacteraceae bacterium]